jgi:hypothetical protein
MAPMMAALVAGSVLAALAATEPGVAFVPDLPDMIVVQPETARKPAITAA